MTDNYTDDHTALGLEPAYDAAQCVLLMELDIRIGIAVLDVYDETSNCGYAGKVAVSFLVRVFRILLACLNELVVEVKVDAVSWIELTRDFEKFEQQGVEPVGDVE